MWNILTVGGKKRVNFNKAEGCLVSASGSASSSWLDSPCIGSGLHHPALTSTMQKLPEKPSGKLGSATDELSEPHSEDEFSGYVMLLTFHHPTLSCLCQKAENGFLCIQCHLNPACSSTGYPLEKSNLPWSAGTLSPVRPALSRLSRT